MNKSLCLPASFPHDMRLLKMLNSHELKHFLLLLCFANTRRDPTFIPAQKIEELRLSLGLNREKFQKRLDRWAAPGIDLIQIDEESGGFLIAYLVDQEEDGEDDDYSSPPLNGNANGHAPRVQKRRQYSRTPAAQRVHAAYWRNKAKIEGVSAGGDSGEGFDENLTQNLTPDTLKPYASSEGFDANVEKNLTQNLTPDAKVSRAHVRNVNTYSENLKILKDSEYVNTLQPEQNLTPLPPKPSPEDPPPAPLRTSCPPQDAAIVRAADVRAAMSAAKAKPEYRPLWLALWKHCNEAERLDIWDQGVAVFIEAQRKRPPAGPGSIADPAKWLTGTLKTMLRNARCEYNAAVDDPGTPIEVSSEERAEIDAAIDDFKRRIAEERGEEST